MGKRGSHEICTGRPPPAPATKSQVKVPRTAMSATRTLTTEFPGADEEPTEQQTEGSSSSAGKDARTVSPRERQRR